MGRVISSRLFLAAILKNFIQAGCQSQHGLAGAGPAHERHHLDGIIEEQVQGKFLFFIQGLDCQRTAVSVRNELRDLV